MGRVIEWFAFSEWSGGEATATRVTRCVEREAAWTTTRTISPVPRARRSYCKPLHRPSFLPFLEKCGKQVISRRQITSFVVASETMEQTGQQKLNVVLLGYGRIGLVHAESITRHPRLNLLAIVGSNEKKVSEIAKKFGTRGALSLATILVSALLSLICLLNHTWNQFIKERGKSWWGSNCFPNADASGLYQALRPEVYPSVHWETHRLPSGSDQWMLSARSQGQHPPRLRYLLIYYLV